ncbi:MAG: BadM/Rrf2 family transcriptional regulator [Candidatus Dactylopiibacterium carminicum]|uniref:BadM/Rrf2 family transcriptional regulator n=1 Tax=Candidatus Dactylopiibacterium carminicum TaxID=857335 RepID=A0A272EQ38_9RHOO|nr:Rrf2 family transcriptional regulator [Candidatus Dactylopiibacterium carminicum]KAF7598522.1 BadM/Rrf2 family transcriptional regulator [Candidatus Dactylopiibacterium carminicum]PAS92245.1 MAG: BadM/Rrf2 family transcriptional regulator [Candidatus Dactylopiibacterium carminicum]PAS95761.1 MAG: BadM/Rrf2 family transcriptional regulator [Candidatus Dactylopiibacterium carminicum]PAS98010.1 MAG: BadM/Rrf2 family transcriptional regulator [Candidatus Dactylopiibacterium carminicum]
MKLTTYTDYTLRVLMYLALRPEHLATIQGIAQAYGISESHLMKVVQQLGKSGFVEALRGKGGGLRLAVPASQVGLGVVVRAAEGDGPIVECFVAPDRCRITPGCRLVGVLHEAREAFYGVLDRYTLADLVCDPAPLAHLLGIPVVSVPPGPAGVQR